MTNNKKAVYAVLGNDPTEEIICYKQTKIPKITLQKQEMPETLYGVKTFQ